MGRFFASQAFASFLAALAFAAIIVIMIWVGIDFSARRSAAAAKASCPHWYALDPKEDITTYELARIVSGGSGGGLGGPICEEKEGAIPADLRRHFRELAQ